MKFFPIKLPNIQEIEHKDEEKHEIDDNTTLTFGEKESEAILQRTIGSMRSDQSLVGGSNKLKLFLTVLKSLILPTIYIMIVFIYPVCGLYDDVSCHTSYKRIFKWITGFLVVLPFHLLGVHCFQDAVCERIFKTKLPIKIHVILIVLQVLNTIINTEILSVLVSPVVPFLWPAILVLDVFPLNLEIFVCLYYKFYKPYPQHRADLLWGSFCTCAIEILASITIGLYVAYGVIYRKLESDPTWNIIWSIFVLAALREICLFMICYFWERFFTAGFVITYAYCFLVHAMILAILRGGAEGSIYKILALSVADLSSVIFSLAYLWYEERKSKRNELMILKLTMYILLEELVETIVPPIYCLTTTFFYHTLGDKFAGIGTTAFGIKRIENLELFQYSLFVVWICEVFTFVLVWFAIRYISDVNPTSTISFYFQEYGFALNLSIAAGFCTLFALQYMPFGADTSFQFDWL